MKSNIEAKLAKLNDNKEIVMKNLKDLEAQTKKNMNDLQAISGAIQVCEQLIKEADELKEEEVSNDGEN